MKKDTVDLAYYGTDSFVQFIKLTAFYDCHVTHEITPNELREVDLTVDFMMIKYKLAVIKAFNEILENEKIIRKQCYEKRKLKRIMQNENQLRRLDLKRDSANQKELGVGGNKWLKKEGFQ